MRLVVLTLLLLAASACGDRRSFDQRYDDTSRTLENKAEQLDQNLSETNLSDR